MTDLDKKQTFSFVGNLSNGSLIMSTTVTSIGDIETSTYVEYDLSSSSNVTTDYHLSLPTGYTWVHLVIASVLVVFIVFIIIFGNLLVVVAIGTDRNLKTTQNWFIASLAVADSLLGLVIMPFSLANELMGYWYFGSVWCDLWKAIDVLLCTASINSICLISLDRYWSITRAVQYARQRTAKRASLMIAAVWLLSAIICVPPLIGWKNPLPASDYPMCLLSEDIGYVLYSSMGSFYIPAVIMVFVYFKIYLAARARARRNVKKPRIICAEDGQHSKSSTSLTAVTKNNNPSVKKNHSSHHIEPDPSSYISDDESTWPTAKHMTACQKGDMKLRIFDEKTKLIVTDSEDTDVNKSKNASESECNNEDKSTQNRTIILLTDTESSLDSPKTLKEYQNNKIATANENTTAVITVTSVEPIQSDSVVLNAVKLNHESMSSENEVKLGSIKQSAPNGNHVLSPPQGGLSTRIPSFTKIGNIFIRKNREQPPVVENKGERIFRSGSLREHERQKRKLAKARERRATIVLGLVMAAFIFCWFPFFTLYVTSAFCDFCIPNMVFAVFFWAGYCNSALNPIIYTIFNRDFRQAFHRIIFRRSLCKRR